MSTEILVEEAIAQAVVKPKIISASDKEVIQELKVLETEIEFDFFRFLGDNSILNTPWAKAAIILAAFILIAFFVKLVVFFLLKKITNKTKSNIDNKVVLKIQKPMFITIILLGVLPSLVVLNLADNYLVLIHKIILSVIFLMWMFTFMSVSKLTLTGMAYSTASKKIISKQTLPLFLNFSAIFILVIFSYIILSTWNVDMTAFVASAGVMGIAIGFAAKDTLSNLISGVLILADQPYKIGDFVVLEAGDRGEVTHIGIRTTRIRTRDDVEVTVPNSVMGNTKIINESGGPYEKFRIRIKIGVAYGTQVEKVRQVLLELATQSDSVCDAPEPRVRLRSFGASSLDFELLCWVPSPILRGRVIDELNEKVYIEFNQAGIEIPFQQFDLHIKRSNDQIIEES